MNATVRALASVAVVLTLAVGTAQADVAVSVTLTGSVDEMMPILQHIRDMGYGTGQGAPGEKPIKFRVDSVTTEEEVACAEEGAAAEPKPVLALQDAAIAPAKAKAGDQVVVTVEVCDPDSVVDTVAASIGGNDLDLNDNGANGDVAAGDGVWSAALEVPAGVTDGAYVVKLTAYDAHGYPVPMPGAPPEGDDKAAPPLTAEATVRVSR